MAVSPSYLDFVLEQLANVRRVSHRRMFGGVGDAGVCAPGKPPMRGYFQVPPGVLEDVDELTIWANEAITVGAAAPPKRPKS